VTLAFGGWGGGQLIFKHDASRIVQTLLKVGSQGVRQNIAEEMKGHYVALAKSAYARNTVLKVLLYLYVLLFNGGGWGALCFNRLCVSRPAMRKAVIREFYGHVIPMLRHKEASLVIEEIFLEYAKQNERLSLLEEFYGPEFSLFKTTENSEPKTLGEIKQSHPEKMPAILKNLQQTIQDMINKGTVRFNIAHHAIMEFMTHAPVAQVQVRPRTFFLKYSQGSSIGWAGLRGRHPGPLGRDPAHAARLACCHARSGPRQRQEPQADRQVVQGPRGQDRPGGARPHGPAAPV